MKFANVKNGFEIICNMLKKYLRCQSIDGGKGQQITVDLPMDLQKVLGETECRFLKK